MSLVHPWIFKVVSPLILKKSFLTGCVLLLLSGSALFGCATQNTGALVKKIAPSKVYISDYDSVWRAAHTVLKYTIAFENQETGRLETEYIRAIDGFVPPENQSAPGFGQKYKIIMQFTKGKVNNKDSVRVTIEKQIENQRDFFSEADSVSSSGLEENVMFYRIARELSIFRALKKAGF